MADVINEGSTSYHAVSFYDEDGNSVNPTTTTYTLLNAEGETIVDWTSFSGEIEVSGSNNVIDSTNGKVRYLTVKGVNSDDTIVTEEIRYQLKSFKGIE